jgi:hypothetical protein
LFTYPLGTAAAIIAAAQAEVGTVEKGENLTKYGKFTKADGLPWCGSFVNWCAHEAGVKIPSMVSTALGAQKMKDLGRWKEKPKLGDLCFMDFPHDGVDRISHIGIVVKVGLKSVLCIEGNTSGTGNQRNGGMVMIKERFLGKEIVGFARPKYVEYAGEFPTVELPKAANKERKK